MMKAPDRIYLQVSDDMRPPEDGHVWKETSWCQDKINDDDIEYVRATPPTGDLREAAQKVLDIFLEETEFSGTPDPVLRWVERVSIAAQQMKLALASQPVETKGPWSVELYLGAKMMWEVTNSINPRRTRFLGTEPQARGVADKLNELEPK